LAVYIKGNPVANATAYKLCEKIVGAEINANLIETPTQSTTDNGIQYAVNANGSVNAFGSATGVSTFVIYESTSFDLKAGTYYLYGCPSGGSTSKYRLILEYGTGTSAKVMTDTGTGDTVQVSSDLTNVPLTVYVYIAAGVTVNNLRFSPMFTSVKDAEFGSTIKPVSYNELAEKTTIDFNVSALNLEVGAHTLVVKATADGYDDSDYSNEVTYTQS
jgi:hypothetical protein